MFPLRSGIACELPMGSWISLWRLRGIYRSVSFSASMTFCVLVVNCSPAEPAIAVCFIADYTQIIPLAKRAKAAAVVRIGITGLRSVFCSVNS